MHHAHKQHAFIKSVADVFNSKNGVVFNIQEAYQFLIESTHQYKDGD